MNSKNYNKNNRKFIHGLRSFKDILPSKIKNLINKKGQIYSEILDNWFEITKSEVFITIDDEYNTCNLTN